MGKSQGAKINLKRSATQASDPSKASRVPQDVNGRVRSGRRPQATEIAAIFTRGRAALASENGDSKNMKRLARDAKSKKSANSAEKSVQQLPRARNRDKANNPTTLNGHKNARVVFVQPHLKGENRTPKDELQKSKEKRKRKRRKKVDAQEVTEDAASKLKKRVKYLFIRMRLEQNFIDAYSNEGWKGQSREKVRPEKELQRAGSQILRYKLAIRDAIRELDLLCQEGAIQEAAFDSEGQIDSEEIFCAICGSHEALIDNDIILCDGACNRGFHQKCLCPPLENEDIPPGDEGWLCNACDSKLDCLYTINDYLGTNFEVESKWEEIFPEAANPPGGMDDDLLSDDSEDDDYDPEGQEKENVEGDMGPEEGSESSSFSASSGSSSSDSSDSDESECNLYGDEPDFNKTSADAEQAARKQGVKGRAKRGIAAELEEIDDGETVVSGKRQRPEVDYKKLNDEMFGKNDSDSDQQSEDMDWGPGRRESQRKTCGDHEENATGSTGKMRRKKEVKAGPSDHDAEDIPKRKKTKIPSDALERLREIFAKNQLPPRSCKEDLARELGLSFAKVNVWFRNARYQTLRKGCLEPCEEANLKASQATIAMETFKKEKAVGCSKSGKKNLLSCIKSQAKKPDNGSGLLMELGEVQFKLQDLKRTMGTVQQVDGMTIEQAHILGNTFIDLKHKKRVMYMPVVEVVEKALEIAAQ